MPNYADVLFVLLLIMGVLTLIGLAVELIGDVRT